MLAHLRPRKRRGRRGGRGEKAIAGEDGARACAGGSAHSAPGARPARQIQVHARARQDPTHHLHWQPLHQGNLTFLAWPAGRVTGDPSSIDLTIPSSRVMRPILLRWLGRSAVDSCITGEIVMVLSSCWDQQHRCISLLQSSVCFSWAACVCGYFGLQDGNSTKLVSITAGQSCGFPFCRGKLMIVGPQC